MRVTTKTKQHIGVGRSAVKQGCAVLAATLFLTASGHAFGQSLADRETARSLMDEGDKKRDAGDLKGALKSYEAADAIMKVPTTGLEVARAQVALGMLLEARETLGRVMRTPSKPNEPAPFSAARKAADTLNNDLTGRIPSIQVALTNAPPNQTPQITIDGEAIPPAAASAPRKVNPGAHVVVVKTSAVERRQDVTLAEHETKTITIDLHVEEAPPTPPPVAAPVPTSEGSSTPKVLMFGGFGLAIVGVGIGAVTGVMSWSKTSELKDACPNNQCPASKQDELDSARTLGNISNVAFIAGGVGAAVGVVGLLMSGNDEKETAAGPAKHPTSAFAPEHVRAVLGPSYVGVAGAF